MMYPIEPSEPALPFSQRHCHDLLAQSVCLYNCKQVEQVIDHMANQIAFAVHDKNPLLVGVVPDSMVFTSGLVLRLAFPLEMDYVHVVSRAQGASPVIDNTAAFDFGVFPRASLVGRTVVVLDHLLDTGVKLGALDHYCRQHGAAQVLFAVLVNRQRERAAPCIQQADFVGIELAADVLIYGYGIGYQGYLRNAPGLYRLPVAHRSC